MGHETNSFDESTQYPTAPVKEMLKGYWNAKCNA